MSQTRSRHGTLALGVGGVLALIIAACSNSNGAGGPAAAGAGGTQGGGAGGSAAGSSGVAQGGGHAGAAGTQASGTAGTTAASGQGGALPGSGGAAAGTGASGGAAAGGGSGGGAAHVGAWKIMPLGDSTTASVCYRPKLWGKLTTAGKTNIDFVGTEKGVSCSDPAPANFDPDNEGHPCYIVSNLVNLGNKPTCSNEDFMADSTDLARWFDSQSPDIVLMHFGTNDVWNGYGPTQILMAYTAILDKLRSRNANVKLFVAQIIPLKPDASKDYDALAKALNSAIPGWATSNSTAASPIVVVDQFTGYVVATDNQSDGVHPNPTGSDKIAQKWFDAIQALL